MNEDLNHLKLLSIFHYVVGGLTALFSCFPLIHVTIGLLMISGKLGTADAPEPPVLVGWIFAVMGGLFVLAGWALAFCMVVAGRKLAQRKSRVFCIVIAGIECMLMPFGTILGVFTLIVLTKASVQQLFEQPRTQPPPLA